MPDLVTVFGGTGFLGRQIVSTLVERGFRVRVATRHPVVATFEKLGNQAGEVTSIGCDIRDRESLGAALDDAMAAVNCVSLYVEKGENTFEALHVRGAEALARLAAARQLRTLVHISGINAGPQSLSAYARARGRGDEAARSAFPEAVVLRPSVIFGPGDNFFNLFAGIARMTPVIPLFGAGATRLQPVFAGDVAEAAVRAIEDPESRGGIFELGGPKAYSYRELLELTLKQTGRRRLLLPIPFPLWRIAATLASPLPRPPVTLDQVALMQTHNLVGADAKSFADLGITPKSVEEILPSYL